MRKANRGETGGVLADDVEYDAARRELYAAEEAHDRLEIAGGLSPGRARDGAGEAECAATQRVRRAWSSYRVANRRRRGE